VILRLVERRPPTETDRYDWIEGLGPSGLLTGLADSLGRPEWEVDAVLVDDPTMARLNEDFRKVQGVTDVLSFSYLQETGTGSPDLAVGRGHAFSNLWLDTISSDLENNTVTSVGEVVLAPGFVADRCYRQEWPLKHEIPMLLVHGLLHILGWDHANPEQTEAMQAVEENILAAAGMPHPLRERS
jgi:rRNA maturation RNase YbeY